MPNRYNRACRQSISIGRFTLRAPLQIISLKNLEDYRPFEFQIVDLILKSLCWSILFTKTRRRAVKTSSEASYKSRSQGVWQLAFGVLAEDIKEACIDALILRFDTDVPELFYHHGKRQVVEVRAKKYSLWHIYLNNAYLGSIQYDTFSKQFNYHLVDNCLLTDDHVQKYSHDTTWGIKVDKGRYSMKKDIKFECDVCGQKQVVEVSVLHGGGTLQIMIDRFFYNGCRFSQWRMGNAM